MNQMDCNFDCPQYVDFTDPSTFMDDLSTTSEASFISAMMDVEDLEDITSDEQYTDTSSVLQTDDVKIIELPQSEEDEQISQVDQVNEVCDNNEPDIVQSEDDDETEILEHQTEQDTGEESPKISLIDDSDATEILSPQAEVTNEKRISETYQTQDEETEIVEYIQAKETSLEKIREEAEGTIQVEIAEEIIGTQANLSNLSDEAIEMDISDILEASEEEGGKRDSSLVCPEMSDEIAKPQIAEIYCEEKIPEPLLEDIPEGKIESVVYDEEIQLEEKASEPEIEAIEENKVSLISHTDNAKDIVIIEPDQVVEASKEETLNVLQPKKNSEHNIMTTNHDSPMFAKPAKWKPPKPSASKTSLHFSVPPRVDRYKSLAELEKEFEKSTRMYPQSQFQLRKTLWTPTQPISPKLSAIRRKRQTNVISHAEEEENIARNIKENLFKATPYHKSSFLRRNLTFTKTFKKNNSIPTTKPRPFVFQSEQRLKIRKHHRCSMTNPDCDNEVGHFPPSPSAEK